MARDRLKNKSVYQGSRIVLATTHAKSTAIAPPFLERLGVSIIEYVVDTDQLGPFSGEVERKGNALECARKKCELFLNDSAADIDFAIASEGNFGRHPFLPCDQEILYFIDRQRGFHLHMSHMSEKTNYRTEKVVSIDELHQLADQISFPSHALILRPNNRETKAPIFEGLDTWQDLEAAFRECMKYADAGVVWVETDMRAQFNPFSYEGDR